MIVLILSETGMLMALCQCLVFYFIFVNNVQIIIILFYFTGAKPDKVCKI